MPTDEKGQYTLPAVYVATPGTDILADQHNRPLEDVAAALSGRLPRNGSAPMEGPLQLAGAPSADLHAATKKYVDDTASGINQVGGVTTAKLAPQAVTTEKLAPQAVTSAKMANLPSYCILGNNSAVSAPPVPMSGHDLLNLFGTAQGSMLLRDASNWYALPPGPAGTVLTSNGPGGNPAYAPVSAGVTYITTGIGLVGGPVTSGGTFSLDTTTGAPGTYAMMVGFAAYGPSATAAGSVLRFSDARGATSATVPAGTWRCMGSSPGFTDPDTGVTTYSPTLWVRIS